MKLKVFVEETAPKAAKRMQQEGTSKKNIVAICSRPGGGHKWTVLCNYAWVADALAGEYSSLERPTGNDGRYTVNDETFQIVIANGYEDARILKTFLEGPQLPDNA